MFFFPMQPTLSVQAQKVLFDEKASQRGLTENGVVHICARGTVVLRYGYDGDRTAYKECLKQGKRSGPSIRRDRGANHLSSGFILCMQ